MFAERLAKDCLGVRVTRLQRLVSRRYADALRPLTPVQLEILAVISLHGQCTPSVLAGELMVEKSTVSRNLALMSEAGWLDAKRSPTGRAMAVALTRKGSRQLIDAQAGWATAQRALVATLGADAAATLDGWITRLS